MGIRSILSKPLAHLLHGKNNAWINNADQAQERIFHTLIETAKATEFGRRHSFEKIHSYEDYKKHVPVREYEGIKEYVDLILEGRQNILWPGKPLYLAKTSGTTSGSKYIPITKESIPNHINSTRELGLIIGNGSYRDWETDRKSTRLNSSHRL